MHAKISKHYDSLWTDHYVIQRQVSVADSLVTVEMLKRNANLEGEGLY